MVQFLVIQIKLNAITIEQVPEKYKEAVNAVLQIAS